MTRRGRPLLELLFTMTLLSLLMGNIAPGALRASRQHEALATWIDDLKSGAALADGLARELRQAARVVPLAPGGVHRTSATSLVLAGPSGELSVYRLERRRPDLPAWLVRLRLDASGRPLGREVLGQLEALALRFEQRAALGVVGVAFDLTLPRRTEGAREAVLSSFALVGGGEALR